MLSQAFHRHRIGLEEVLRLEGWQEADKDVPSALHVVHPTRNILLLHQRGEFRRLGRIGTRTVFYRANWSINIRWTSSVFLPI